MENWEYIFCGAIIAISVLPVVFCIVRGKGALHKMLVFFVSALGVTALVCFGGQAVLNLFGMGWRCEPFNTMLMLCAVLFVIILCCCIGEFITLFKNANPARGALHKKLVFKNADRALIVCGYISLSLAIFITLISALAYFTYLNWSDGLTTYNDQTIVYATNGNGSFGAWRYYTHINGLVHGVEITLDGWYLAPPRKF